MNLYKRSNTYICMYVCTTLLLLLSVYIVCTVVLPSISIQQHVSSSMVDIQVQFKDTLHVNIEQFAIDSGTFVTEYTNEGPMVEGLTPQEASERLGIYQARFDDLWRKYQTFSDGERLFGLPVTDYSELHRIKKVLNLLQKLYQLYNLVMDSVDGYYDVLWQEVDIEKINSELLDFQNR